MRAHQSHNRCMADGGPVKPKRQKKRGGSGPSDSTNAFGRDVTGDPGIWKKVLHDRTNTYRHAREELGQYPGHDGLDSNRVWNEVDDAEAAQRKRNLTKGMKDGGPVKKKNPFKFGKDEGKESKERPDFGGKKKGKKPTKGKKYF